MAKSLVVVFDVDVDGKGKGSIRVFVPIFVIGGYLIVDIDNEGWTEAWARAAAAATSYVSLATPPVVLAPRFSVR